MGVYLMQMAHAAGHGGMLRQDLADRDLAGAGKHPTALYQLDNFHAMWTCLEGLNLFCHLVMMVANHGLLAGVDSPK